MKFWGRWATAHDVKSTDRMVPIGLDGVALVELDGVVNIGVPCRRMLECQW
jgi:hypothetical protein